MKQKSFFLINVQRVIHITNIFLEQGKVATIAL